MSFDCDCVHGGPLESYRPSSWVVLSILDSRHGPLAVTADRDCPRCCGTGNPPAPAASIPPPYMPIHPWHPFAPAPDAAPGRGTDQARHLAYLQLVAEHLADPRALAAVAAVRDALEPRP